jgi:hypothetical protein
MSPQECGLGTLESVRHIGDCGLMPSRAFAGEAVFVLAHVNAASADLHALCFQVQTLLMRAIASEQNAAASAHHAMPGYSSRLLERPHDLPRPAWETSGASHRAVTCYFAARNSTNGIAQFVEHRARRLDPPRGGGLLADYDLIEEGRAFGEPFIGRH